MRRKDQGEKLAKKYDKGEIGARERDMKRRIVMQRRKKKSMRKNRRMRMKKEGG